MGRSPCCEKVGLKKGPWTPEEDQKLMAYIEQHGHGSWRALPSKAGLQRCGKSCRLRWTNYLRPDIKRGKFSLQEERTIIQLHALLGNRWSAIAAHLAKRTDNEIKNYWNTHLKKRLTRMGIDPTTHKPKTDVIGSAPSSHHSKDAANLSHMAQWESARLEAEARLVRDSKFHLSAASSSSASFSSDSTRPARLVLNKISAHSPLPPCLDILKAWQNSWSPSPTTTTKDKTTRVHNMYALMLAAADGDDDLLESPTSTLSFPEPMLPPPLISASTAASAVTTTARPTNENSLPPAAGAVEPWGCLRVTQEEEGERRRRRLEDDDIMVAVEAFMGERYKNVAAEVVLSSNNSVLEGVNANGDEFDDVLLYDSNQNLASEQGLGFISNNVNDSICSNVNFEESKNFCSWNSIYTELGGSFAN